MKFCQKLSVILEAKQLCKMNLVVLTLNSSRTQKGLSSNLQSIIFFQRTLKGYECMSLFGSPPFMKDFWDTPQPASVNMAHLLPWKRSLILNHRMSLVLSPPVRSSLGNSSSMVLDRCEAPLLASWYFASCCVFFSKGHCVGIVPIIFSKASCFNKWDALRRGCFFKPSEWFPTRPYDVQGCLFIRNQTTSHFTEADGQRRARRHAPREFSKFGPRILASPPNAVWNVLRNLYDARPGMIYPPRKIKILKGMGMGEKILFLQEITWPY